MALRPPRALYERSSPPSLARAATIRRVARLAARHFTDRPFAGVAAPAE